MSTERLHKFVLNLDTKLPEIENIPSLGTEVGCIGFRASNNKSKFLVLLFIASNRQIQPSMSSDLNGFLPVSQEIYE